jgi:tetratricopeptide (TPR) repeat protein
VQVCECRAKAIVAHEKAAEANLRGGGTAWHAAKHYEDAAKLSAELRNFSQVAEFIRQASQNYVDVGKLVHAAESLAKGARMLEEASPSQSCELYKAAIDMYSKSEMAAMADDTVKRAVMVLLHAKQPDDAASVLLQWASICHRTGSTAHMCRAYLGVPSPELQVDSAPSRQWTPTAHNCKHNARMLTSLSHVKRHFAAAGVIVMQLHAGNAPQAWKSYQDFLDVEEFSTSGEAYAVENLMEAYCSCDPELIQKKALSGSCWTSLDAPVCYLKDASFMCSHCISSVSRFLRCNSMEKLC